MKKLAVVLFNLGGPDQPDSIRPFLFNLFNDKAIIGAPQPIRFLLAKFISSRRDAEARQIYSHIGGKSPLLDYTERQAAALQEKLNQNLPDDFREVKTFIAMRYWHPLTEAAVEAVKTWAPDEVLLLPLYPQFAGATSGSSINAWKRAATGAAYAVRTRAICCYPQDNGFVEAQADLIAAEMSKAVLSAPLRILFSAHGLPKKMIEKGDPYQGQINAGAAAIVAALDRRGVMEKISDWRVTFQSRVGPLEWIKPYTEDEIKQAGQEKTSLMIVPIAFVSEHSETLVELDIEYGHMAKEAGVPEYIRVPAVSLQDKFIDGLDGLVRSALKNPEAMQGYCEGGICPTDRKLCARRLMGL